MAQSAASVLGGGQGSDPASSMIGGVLSGVNALKGGSQSRYSDSEQKLDDAATLRDQNLTEIEHQRDAIAAPPPMQPIPMPKAEHTDPRQAWGSAAMFLAMFASAFTRQPMVTALNAAAGVLKAYQAKDQAAFTQAFNTWKVANENALRMSEFQNKTYQASLAALDRRERLTREDYDSRVREVTAEIHAKAQAFKDDVMQQTLALHGVEAAVRLQEDREKQGERFRENAGKIEQQAQEAEQIRDLEADPKYQAAGPLERARMVAEIAKPQIAMMTPAQKANLTVKLQKSLTTDDTGKPWAEIRAKWPIIAHAAQQMKDAGHLDAQTSAAVVDGFQRIYNNQAVRIGLVKLNTEHAPYMDQLALETSKWQAGGGGVLAPAQAADLLGLLHEYKDNLKKLRQNQIDEVRDTAKAYDIDPDVVANPRYVNTDLAQPIDWEPHPGFKANPAGVIQAALGVPVRVTSNGRSPSHNAAVGGSPTSEHLGGNAWDFVPEGLSPRSAAYRLYQAMTATGQPFDQIEFTPNHVHIGFGPKNRGEIIDENGRHYNVREANQQPSGGKGAYDTADKVIAAYHAGQLSYADAADQLKKFGYN